MGQYANIYSNYSSVCDGILKCYFVFCHFTFLFCVGVKNCKCVYVAPDDDRALAKNLIRIWDDRSLQQQMVEAGYRYAHNFADEKLAADLMQVYEKVLNV